MKYTCSNCCKTLPILKEPIQSDSGSWIFGYHHFYCCPNCGALTPDSLKTARKFFKLDHIHHDLDKAIELILKSEYNSASREAFIVVESKIRSLSGLDMHGKQLASKALAYKFDASTDTITEAPLIQLNGLKTESERNEQEGLMLMLMGFFQGVRNIYQHNNVGSGYTYAFNVIVEASFFLWILNGNSLTKHGKWIPVKINYNDIYRKMPNKWDRFRFRIWLRKRRKKDF